MKTRHYIIIAITAVLVFTVLIVLIVQSETSGPDYSGGPGGGPGGGDGPGREDNYFAEPFFTGDRMDPKAILTQYKQYAIYPPTSRPLKKEMIGLMEPNRRYENFLPIGGPPEGFDQNNPPKNPPKAEFYYLLTGDRYYVVGDGAVTFTLQAAPLPTKKAAPVPMRVLSASVNKGRSHLDYKKFMDVRFNDEGSEGDRKAGDLIYTLRFQPSSTPLINYMGRLQLYVKFEIGDETTEALVPFEYFPESAIPARFTGRFSDRLSEGSLLVSAGIKVEKAGYYIIDANLFDSEDQPVAYTRFKGDLEGGEQVVNLEFFGKVIVDQDPTPPFYVKNVRGYRLLEGQSPDRQLIPSYEGSYQTTGNYSDPTVFSDAEYDSAQKRKKIEFLEREIESGVKMPPPPAP